MELIATTLSGIEDISIREINSLFKTKAKKILDGRIEFSIDEKNIKNLNNLRSVDNIYILIKKFKFKSEKEIYENVKKIKFKIKEPFVVRCNRIGKHKFNSKNVEQNTGEIIFKQGYKVNLEKFKTQVYVEIINNNFFIGIKVFSNLAKREYRVKTSNRSINPLLAYSLIKIADLKKSDTLLDPFSKDGVIAIEAALLGYKKVYAFDSEFLNVKNTRINSKIANVKIETGQYDVSWLDTLFKEKNVFIVTSLPFLSKRTVKEDLIKLYKEFFHQAKHILKKKMIIVSQKTDLIKKYSKGFKVKKNREVKIGDTKFIILEISR